MEFKDYYHIIGVKKDASEDDIKRAYRKLARKYHPDVSKEPGAEAKFKEVNEAYDVLKDPEKRKAYDQLGANWKAGQQFNPNEFDFSKFKDFQGFQGFHAEQGAENFSDFFESLFGGSMRGQGRQRRYQPRSQEGEDLHVSMTLSLQEAYQGEVKTLELLVPQLNAHQQWQEVPKTLKVRIPAGVAEGQQIRLNGQGAAGVHGGKPGDLYIKIHLTPHPLFRVEGKDLHLSVPLAPWEAALGASITVPTLSGALTVKVPSGAHTGQKLRLKDKGLLGKPEGGALYLELQIQTPKAETPVQKEMYEKMASAFDFNPRASWQGGQR